MKNYNDILTLLLNHSENEVVEFKAAKNNYDVDDLGKYFSALSNEANLREHDFAWIVFGIDNKTHIVTGTNFKEGEQALNRLKQDMSQHTTDNLIFREIVPLFVEGKRVLMFKIPASPRNIVMHWKGIAYARDGESLKPLNQTKRDEIRHQSPIPDWTAQLVPNATIDDLDELALATARIMYKKVHSNIPAQEIDGWSKEDFLSNSNMMRDGQITRAAILLLGKPLSLNKIHPAVAQITWTLQDDEDIVDDYEHFTIPFLLTVDKVLAKIRNKTMRELPGGTLFPDTMKQYDDYTIREALHNCIAHQDYTLQQRINFVENPGYLYYSNAGTFLPGTLENALRNEESQSYFRNECLCKAMVDFNMIDTVSRGIKNMFNEQLRRHFPMPDYEIDAAKKKVFVRIYGNEINKRYTDLLKTNNSLSLWDCISLDAVQKGRLIHEDVAKDLLCRGLIEGEAPNYSISLGVAKNTHQLPSYTKTKGLDKEKLRQMILQYLKNAGNEGAKRDSIYEYIKDVLPQSKSHEQQLRMLGDILNAMKEENLIMAKGRTWHERKT